MIHTRTSAASFLGVHPDTLKRWEDEGVVPEADRDSAGRRVYSESQLQQLQQVASERRLAHEKRMVGE